MEEKIYDDINLAIAKLNIKNKTILDIGCGTGLLGSILKRKGNYVMGINNSKQEIKIALNKIDECKYYDVITGKKFPFNKRVDIMIFADILEHTPNPKEVILKLEKFLKKDGKIILSIPNICCYNLRIRHLFGYYDYDDFGTLDRTHLRFFTKKEIKRLLDECGFKIIYLTTTPYFIRPLFKVYRSLCLKFKKNQHKKSTVHDINQDILKSKLFNFYSKYFFPIENILPRLYPSLFSYQFITVCKKK